MQTEQQTIQFAHEYAQALAMVVIENLINKELESKKMGIKSERMPLRNVSTRFGWGLD